MSDKRIDRTITRRTFLKGASAAALSAPFIVPASALGRAGRPAPSERIVIGCIGVGGMGKGNMRSFLRRGGVQVVAVCDVDDGRTRNARDIVEKHYRGDADKRGYRGCAMYREYERLLDRSDIDAVSIATPDHWHALNAIHAARAGKDMYCEKPLGLTIAEGRATVSAVARYGRIFQTGSWQRSVRNFRYACELVRSGRIGKIHAVHVGVPNGKVGGSTEVIPVPEGLDYDRWLGPAPWEPYTEDRTHYDFRWHFDYSGGIVTDWGAHHCDIAQWGLGTELAGPVEFEGQGEFPTTGLWNTADRFFFTAQYANGVNLTVSSKNNPNRQGTRFEGDKGWVFVSRSRLEAEPRSLLRSVIGPGDVRLYRSDSHIDNFLDCVKSRAETITPAEIAHRSISVAHLGNIAMRLGRKVRWNPETERFVNDPVADRMLSVPMREPYTL